MAATSLGAPVSTSSAKLSPDGSAAGGRAETRNRSGAARRPEQAAKLKQETEPQQETEPAQKTEPAQEGPQRGWLSEPEQEAWRSFQVMQARLNAALAHDLAQHSELSAQDYVVLVALTDQPGGELRLFQLGEMLGWEKSRVSHQVSRMTERGLVRKSRCGADRRGATIEVTARGREAIRAAAPSHVDGVRRYFVDILTNDELRQLGDICQRVVDVIDEQLGSACRRAPAPGPEDAAPGSGNAAPGSGNAVPIAGNAGSPTCPLAGGER